MNRSRVAAATTVVLTAGWLAVGGPLLVDAAGAQTPLGWAPVSSVPVLHWLLLFAVPLALFVVITLLVMGPAWASGERRSETGGGSEETWFGGPARASHELPAAEADSGDRGGAGGRW